MSENPPGKHWRYQAVVHHKGSESWVTMIEVYLDENDKLTGWVQRAAHPTGVNSKALVTDLLRMLANAGTYLPVEFNQLRPGMTFTRSGIDTSAIVDVVKQLGGDVDE